MSKAKWVLIMLAVMDLILIILHITDYYILLLKPTGYLIPLAINITVLSIIGFRSSRFKWWTIIVLIAGIVIFIGHGTMILLLGNSYTKIDSPHSNTSLVIESRHVTLGETNYFYNFYKTNFGIVGKQLKDQSFQYMERGYGYPNDTDEEGVRGLKVEEWVTDNLVRFSTLQGTKDVQLNDTKDVSVTDIDTDIDTDTDIDIDAFIEKVNSKEDGQTITINGNRLEVRFDEAADQSWIDVNNEMDEGAIPRQQCSRIVADKERGYYILEECTHRWEYNLYPLPE